ncbi:hypothetical protein [Sandarakinorhabdus oryzae]|uniref:hypothetical protein n=1 Tax=Sandarakinorhabdus oryzae TaxID=2675220 RepID=UPI0012E26B34|nr:hypothetical protein [Sandarakinorhabdus oryzae]
MASVGRFALVVLAALAGFIAANIVLGPWLGMAAGAGVGFAAWVGTASRHPLVRGAVLGAGWCGLIGFVGGFFGPMLLTPDANQGPMLGLFITGPGGVVIGGLCGALIAAGKPG